MADLELQIKMADIKLAIINVYICVLYFKLFNRLIILNYFVNSRKYLYFVQLL